MKPLIFCLALLAPLASVAQPTALAAEAPASSYQQLATLFTEWREFNHPAIVHGRPDYSASAMTKKAKGLAAFRARLKAINPRDWPIEQKNDLFACKFPLSSDDDARLTELMFGSADGPSCAGTSLISGKTVA